MKFKSIRIGTINWHEKFEEVKGSYYDYVCSVSSFDEVTHSKITEELISKGWREVFTSNDDLSLFEKERHVIRLNKIWIG